MKEPGIIKAYRIFRPHLGSPRASRGSFDILFVIKDASFQHFSFHLYSVRVIICLSTSLLLCTYSRSAFYTFYVIRV